MSDLDITRPIVTETGIYPDGKAVAVHGTGHSTSTHIDASNRKNDALPWLIITVVAIVACSLSGIALGLAISARDRAIIAEREARLIEDDTKFIRAFLSARGIHIPANHEEVEDR